MKVKDLHAQIKSGAGCLIITKEYNFLLLKRSEYVPAPLTWCLPGGRVNQGEEPIDAAIRETHEEIGYDLSNHKLHLIYTNDYHAPRFRFYTYACIISEKFEPTLNWENQEYQWASMDDLPEPLHWGVEQLISSDIAGKLLKNIIIHKH